MRYLTITATATFAGPATPQEEETGGREGGQVEEEEPEIGPEIGPGTPAVLETSAVRPLTTLTSSPGHCWQKTRPWAPLCSSKCSMTDAPPSLKTTGVIWSGHDSSSPALVTSSSALGDRRSSSPARRWTSGTSGSSLSTLTTSPRRWRSRSARLVHSPHQLRLSSTHSGNSSHFAQHSAWYVCSSCLYGGAEGNNPLMTSCRQIHTEYKLLALSSAGDRLEVDTFMLPSACACYTQQNSFSLQLK